MTNLTNNLLQTKKDNNNKSNEYLLKVKKVV